MRKGNLKLDMNGITQVITDVYYLSSLKKNLLSVGQLIQKDLTIIIKDGGCKVLHGEKGLIMSTQISSNKIFVVSAHVIHLMCMKVTTNNVTHL